LTILISGLINIETTCRVSGFPIAYNPVNYPFFGVNSTVSGVGYNVARALTTLGDDVRFCSLIGDDLAGGQVLAALAVDSIDDRFICTHEGETAQSVILYDPHGRRQIHTDLKDIQDRPYPLATFERALAGADFCALCNINFSRPLLTAARRAGVSIATDVHAIAALDDAYNADFMAAADVLFMSDEQLPTSPEAWAAAVIDRYAPQVLVIGLGARGALLAVPADDFMYIIPAVQMRPIANTIGAGDALFSAFLHTYAWTGDPYLSLRRAVVFAGWKIGVASAADGFLTAVELVEFENN